MIRYGRKCVSQKHGHFSRVNGENRLEENTQYLSNLDYDSSRKIFLDGDKAYVFICYNNEDNKRIEVVTSAALEKRRSLTLKIVWTINLKNKEKNVFIRRDHQNLNVRSTEINVYLFLMIKGNVYMPLKRSNGGKSLQ